MLRRIILPSLILILALGNVGPVFALNQSGSQGLETYIGKYPTDLLNGVPGLKARLKTLLGANYQAFMDRMAVQSPIEKIGGTIFLHGCMAHACTFEEAAMAITLPDQKLHCATLSKPLEGKPAVQTFNEGNTPTPSSLKQAVDKFLQ